MLVTEFNLNQQHSFKLQSGKNYANPNPAKQDWNYHDFRRCPHYIHATQALHLIWCINCLIRLRIVLTECQERHLEI